ncbi:MAG TPA: flagellar hook protein FlgE [Bryobacteraceae bacterium]|jgi:flagellar hook protein FlgE|nr:flagellar hook protein FlgE [Bryobacteraceae bacterium]
MSSFSAPLSGLLANTKALNIVGDNLANMNTQGFKGNTVLFEDAMGQANASLQIGDGVGSTLTERDFSQGTLQTTNGPLDAAIQGNGFFVVQTPSGETMYSRDGSFSLNSGGQLVTSTGNLVQGWMATNGVANPSGPVTDITVPSLTPQPPAATQNMTLTANLNAAAASGSTFSTPIQVVDSLGNTHVLTVNFTETAANSWSYDVTIPGQDLTGGTAGANTSIGTGTLKFDASGNLTSPAAGSPVAIKTTTGLADGASDLNINWNLYNPSGAATLTQFAQTSAATGTSQDGTQPGSVTGVSLQNGGMLVATYSNGNVATIAQVAVASVSNPDSLISVANNNYTLGVSTLTPSVGGANTGERGSIVAGSLETSNVDMATQFTNLIVFQRGYEANSKVITTINQMDQTLLAIQI